MLLMRMRFELGHVFVCKVFIFNGYRQELDFMFVPFRNDVTIKLHHLASFFKLKYIVSVDSVVICYVDYLCLVHFCFAKPSSETLLNIYVQIQSFNYCPFMNVNILKSK